ncbi:hypothetical protein [Actinomadura bangladeshensis]|uniref:Uncharacterized protein n=1 Tax=Actinomadura bangladeshensis TaxID=453573 RepID=A0A6L9QX34_9ACTN|nr:hypothetical protein [Actinomadura bangladeshensis]NEA28464.1 hypothetical protein [Actinomadura bangladeshensis]
MSERMEAAALALDAYEQHLFGDLANGHRTDHAEAEGLLHALVVDLINYGEVNRLDVVDLLDALVQARIDRGGAIINPRYSFRLDTEVQFRDRDAEPYRGFITELKSSGPGQDAECVLRIPGVIDPQHTTTWQLEPATRMAPILTRTCGTAYSALDAEDTITELITRLPRHQPDPDPHALADLTELSAALATWSGTKPEWVLEHARFRAGEIRPVPDGPSPAARRAATGFPNDIAALLAGEQPAPSPSSRPDPPTANPHPRQM